MLMHRLFSSFPNSWPGAALLLLRLCASAAIAFLAMHSTIQPETAPFLLIAVAWLSAALILAGLWTPIAAAMAAVTEGAETLAGAPEILSHMLVAAIAVSLVFLGPGAWSIDAHLYGRKRLI
jgi:uncharacterized membrane protein YphA (DoxX/SURF4 family)